MKSLKKVHDEIWEVYDNSRCPKKSLPELLKLKRRAYGYLRNMRIANVRRALCERSIWALDDRIAELKK